MASKQYTNFLEAFFRARALSFGEDMMKYPFGGLEGKALEEAIAKTKISN